MEDKDLMKLREASIEYYIAEKGRSLPFNGRDYDPEDIEIAEKREWLEAVSERLAKRSI